MVFMIYPGRCGTCKRFPGEGKVCHHDTLKRDSVRSNDYGKDKCKNYEKTEVVTHN